jgi:putative ABC transport system permease protein
MFKLNLKIALRNLIKNKVYAAINIGGLAIGLTAFVLLLLFVNHEASYDQWDPGLSKVYQIREHHDFFTPDNKQHWMESNDSRIGKLLANKVPQFKYVTKIGRDWGGGFGIKIAHADPLMVQNVRDADSLFFKVFPYQFVQGDKETAISSPNTMVLKESLAMKLFGTTKVLGKQVKLVMWRQDEGTLLTITGVVAEPACPQSVVFNAITHTGDREKDPDQLISTNYCEIYAATDRTTDLAVINKTLQRVYVDFKKASFVQRKISFNDFYKNGNTPGLMAVPLQEVYGNPSTGVNWFDRIKPIVALSIFLLLVSIINFVNLATAQSVQRAKEVGVKKVLGAYKKQLVMQFLLESAIQSFTALFICVILVEILLPSFSQHFDVQLGFWHSPQLPIISMQLFGLFILITLLAGFYPAWVLSKYNPVKVLKGNYETGFGGIFLRNGLVVLQFVIAVSFIIGIGVMQLQTNFIANKNLGFNRDKLINIATNYNTNDPFAESIKRITGVKYVATTTQVMGNTFNVPEEVSYKNQIYHMNTVTVTMDALPALDVKVVKGRIFSPSYQQDTINSVVLNETAANMLDKNIVGKQYKVLDGPNKSYVFQVVGVIKDYNNEGFDKAILPTVYKVTSLGGTSNTNNLLVRFESANYKAALREIELTWKKQYPDYPIKYTTLEDSFQQEMKATRRIMQMVRVFSLISVILSLLGLFALATFMAKRRTKEIAIRKILGATDLQLINMLNRSFLVLVISANLISWPIAFILSKKWLEGFAYRIDMPLWPFLIATLSSIVIAVFTVSIQARKAAVNNPVNALKYE